MTTNTCATCKHWDAYEGDGTAACLAIEPREDYYPREVALKSKAEIWGDSCPELITAIDFGCVLHELREGKLPEKPKTKWDVIRQAFPGAFFSGPGLTYDDLKGAPREPYEPKQ